MLVGLLDQKSNLSKTDLNYKNTEKERVLSFFQSLISPEPELNLS